LFIIHNHEKNGNAMNKKWVLLTALALLSCGKSVNRSDEIKDNETFKDPDHRLIWKQEMGNTAFCTPGFSPDESVVYVGECTGKDAPAGRTFYAVNAGDGSIRWRYRLESTREVVSPVVVAHDSVLYFAADDGNIEAPGTLFIYAFNVHGNLKWIYTVGAARDGEKIHPLTCPALGADGTLYTGGNGLIALHPDGTVKWKFGAGFMRTSPTIGKDGAVYWINGDSRDVQNPNALYAVNPDGTVRWVIDFGAGAEGAAMYGFSPVIDGDGNIYINLHHSIYKLSPTGARIWEFKVNDDLDRYADSAPVIAPDGTVYAGSKVLADSGIKARTYAIRPDGTLKWFHEISMAGRDTYDSPAIGSDGAVYFTNEDGYLYALDPASGATLWSLGWMNSCGGWAAVVMDGRGALYTSNFAAVRTDGHGYASGSSWPKFRHDNQNTGRAQ
jgi:outer membrane protein assembly factor BamB